LLADELAESLHVDLDRDPGQAAYRLGHRPATFPLATGSVHMATLSPYRSM
jgi:hypothetical protein